MLMIMQPKQELRGYRGRDDAERTLAPDTEFERSRDEVHRKQTREANGETNLEELGCEFTVLLHLGLL